MGSITIHDIDDTLNERLTVEARRRRMSKNALIKQLLAEKVGIPLDGAYADDYREFLGLWTAEEHAAFEKTQVENATVDPGDWD
jgi:hypothetical protein